MNVHRLTTIALGTGGPVLAAWAFGACGGATGGGASTGSGSGQSGMSNTGGYNSGAAAGTLAGPSGYSGSATGFSPGSGYGSGEVSGVGSESTPEYPSGATSGVGSGSTSGYGGYGSGSSSGCGGDCSGNSNPIIWDGGMPPIGGICGQETVDSGARGLLPAAFEDGGLCGCTRRPGSGNSFQCPMGVGEEVTVPIGPQGGDVLFEGRQSAQSGPSVDISFPPTALATQTNITLIETTIAPPADLIDWSPVYRVEPLGLTLGASTPLKVPFSNFAPQTEPLGIWFSPDGTCFTRLSDSDANTNIVEASLHQLGYFLVAEQRADEASGCP
jgi:hypothetical protein